MNNSQERLYILDLLRFAAALFVVLYHYIYFGIDSELIAYFSPISSIVKYGHLGVQLFFMISGFVICWSAVGKTRIEFLSSRFARLYPTYLGCLLITSGFVLYNGEFQLTQFFANLTMLQQFFGIPHIDGSYWTLTNEIIFYGFIFILISLNLLQYMNRILAALLFCSLFFWGYVTKTGIQPPIVGTLFMLEYIPYFAAGSIFYNCFSCSWSFKKVLLLLFCCGLSLFDGFRMYQDSYNGATFDKSFAVISVILLSFFIVFTIISLRLVNVKHRFFPILGAITYPLYLIHQRAGEIVLDVIGYNWFTVLSVIVAMIVFSYLFHILFEKRASKIFKSYAVSLFNNLSLFNSRGLKNIIVTSK